MGGRYLVVYNAVQACGWGYMLAKAIATLAGSGSGTSRLAALFGAVRGPLLFFQRLAWLELAHSVLGVVRSPVPTVALQLFSRLALAGVVEHAADAVTGGGSVVVASSWFAMMAVSWGVTEVVRYTHYALSALGLGGSRNAFARLVSTLRYTLFIVLCTSNPPLPALCQTLSRSGLTEGGCVVSQTRAACWASSVSASAPSLPSSRAGSLALPAPAPCSATSSARCWPPRRAGSPEAPTHF